jgi:hypothetical protein
LELGGGAAGAAADVDATVADVDATGRSAEDQWLKEVELAPVPLEADSEAGSHLKADMVSGRRGDFLQSVVL